MGVVVIIGTWLRFVEMVTDVSLDRYLLRAPDGACRTVQNAAHGAAILRGVAGTAFMLASLVPLLAARRPYVIAFHANIQRRLWQAGWPLAANALLLYAVFQGERLFIGGILGLEVLGSYAIAAQLALLPVLIAGRLSTSLALPLLARTDVTTALGIRIREDVTSSS